MFINTEQNEISLTKINKLFMYFLIELKVEIFESVSGQINAVNCLQQ